MMKALLTTFEQMPSIGVGDSILAVAMLTTMGMFLKYLKDHRAATESETAEERKIYRETLDRIDVRHEREHVQVVQRLEQLAADQRANTTALGALVKQLEDRSK